MFVQFFCLLVSLFVFFFHNFHFAVDIDVAGVVCCQTLDLILLRLSRAYMINDAKKTDTQPVYNFTSHYGWYRIIGATLYTCVYRQKKTRTTHKQSVRYIVNRAEACNEREYLDFFFLVVVVVVCICTFIFHYLLLFVLYKNQISQ